MVGALHVPRQELAQRDECRDREHCRQHPQSGRLCIDRVADVGRDDDSRIERERRVIGKRVEPAAEIRCGEAGAQTNLHHSRDEPDVFAQQRLREDGHGEVAVDLVGRIDDAHQGGVEGGALRLPSEALTARDLRARDAPEREAIADASRPSPS